MRLTPSLALLRLAPVMTRLRRMTRSVAPAFTTTALVPLTRMPPQSRVIDLVMVTPPKPPGSRQLISPLSAVFDMAPAKVLHGAVRLHGSLQDLRRRHFQDREWRRDRLSRSGRLRWRHHHQVDHHRLRHFPGRHPCKRHQCRRRECGRY